jgi:hypothetical protein
MDAHRQLHLALREAVLNLTIAQLALRVPPSDRVRRRPPTRREARSTRKD